MGSRNQSTGLAACLATATNSRLRHGAIPDAGVAPALPRVEGMDAGVACGALDAREADTASDETTFKHIEEKLGKPRAAPRPFHVEPVDLVAFQ